MNGSVDVGQMNHTEAMEVLTWLAMQGVNLPTGQVRLTWHSQGHVTIEATLHGLEQPPESIARHWH